LVVKVRYVEEYDCDAVKFIENVVKFMAGKNTDAVVDPIDNELDPV